jgi:hypothetical protein
MSRKEKMLRYQLFSHFRLCFIILHKEKRLWVGLSRVSHAYSGLRGATGDVVLNSR